jgi:hypothetical protein
MKPLNTRWQVLPVLAFVLGQFLFHGQSNAAGDENSASCDGTLRYTFSWSLQDGCQPGPRGGTTKGAPILLDPEPHPGWLALQEPGLTDYEKDRRAILAMAGPYRTSFEFIETVGYTSAFQPARPYQSWGTEYIHVIEDRADFISLQHLMVMFVAGEGGELLGPFVQKHWRQDWQYQKQDQLEFAGQETWRHQTYSQEAVAGTWSQSVFQVDDSPRYEAFGKWQHYPNFSTWLSETTWRPLPRRESSVRKDYQVLEGTNRHTIIPTGWVQEEENYKVKLDSAGNRAEDQPYLSKELGVNRYERITGFDFSAGDEYWGRTSRYWADVRTVWQEYTSAGSQVQIVETAGGVPLFAALFEQAELLTETGNYDSETGLAVIHAILDDYIE